jgi:hypothetical protein
MDVSRQNTSNFLLLQRGLKSKKKKNYNEMKRGILIPIEQKYFSRDMEVRKKNSFLNFLVHGT